MMNCYFAYLATVLVMLNAGWWPAPSAEGITRDNATRIRRGMTLAEVEALLGGPARDEASEPVAADNLDGETGLFRWMNAKEVLPTREWGSDTVWIRVYIGDGNTVVGWQSCNVHPHRPYGYKGLFKGVSIIPQRERK